MAPSKTHLVLLSSPGMGHLFPAIELAKRLATIRDFQVTIFAVASPTSLAESRIIQSAATPELCHLVELPSPDVSALLHPDAAMFTRLCVLMREIKPTFRSAISRLEIPPSVLLVDLFGTESLPIADELNIPKFVFVASNAWLLALTVYSPTLHETVEGEYVDQKEPFIIPGCGPLQPYDVVDPMLDRTAQQYVEYLRLCSEIPMADGVLVNTWEEVQPKPLAAMRDESLLGRIIRVPIFPIGPLARAAEPLHPCDELFNWLEKQPQESVLYVSFGSGGRLSWEQMNELAWGLELSKQRFIWVVRPPAAKRDASFFTSGNKGDSAAVYLPGGFVSRTREVGMVVEEWASQVEILNHQSVGGFLCHSGWNSVLEGINGGVAMIAWPLYAEQRMNATMLSEEMGIAVRPKVLPDKELVGREEIGQMVRKIMVEGEGREMRRRVKEMRRSADRAWEETGSSCTALSQFELLVSSH